MTTLEEHIQEVGAFEYYDAPSKQSESSGASTDYFTLKDGVYKFELVGCKFDDKKEEFVTADGKRMHQQGDMFYRLRFAPVNSEDKPVYAGTVFMELKIPAKNPRFPDHRPVETDKMINSARKILEALDPDVYKRNVFDAKAKRYRDADGDLLDQAASREYGNQYKLLLREALTKTLAVNPESIIGKQMYAKVNTKRSKNGKIYCNWDWKFGYYDTDNEPDGVTYDIEAASVE